MTKRRRAVVVGAGIIGTTSAYALARDGWHVRLVDAREGAALGASLGNGRQLSYSHTDALASPELLPRLPGLALKRDQAFRLTLNLDHSFIGWLMQFMRNCTPARFRRNTLSLLALAERSRTELDRLLKNHHLEFEQHEAGKLVIYRNEIAYERARRVMDMKVRHGSRQQALYPAEAMNVEPALAQCADDMVGAIYAPGDKTGNCHLFANELLSLARQEYGLEFLPDLKVTELARTDRKALVRCGEQEALEADTVVVCCGHLANRLLAPLGQRLPIQPMKGYSFTAPKGRAPPRVSVTDASRRVVFTNVGMRMLVAGIADLGNWSHDCSSSRLDSMRRAASVAMPHAADYDAADDFWTGHRSLTPDSLPITRRLSSKIAVNTGHGMLGWTLAMGSAAALAEELAASS